MKTHKVLTSIKISIITPLFNKANDLRATLTSVKHQTYQNWECIIVDDHSTDLSFNMALDFEKEDERFIVLKRQLPKKGRSVCRNTGIEKSTGEFILFLDADDILLENCLTDRIEKVMNFSQYNLYIFSQGRMYGKEYKVIPADNSCGNFLKAFLKLKPGWSITTPLWQTALIKSLPSFDENLSFYEDIDFAITVLNNENLKIKTFKTYKPDWYYRSYHNKYNELPEPRVKEILRSMLFFLKKQHAKFSYERFRKGIFHIGIFGIEISKNSSHKKVEEKEELLSYIYKVLSKKDKIIFITSQRILENIRIKGAGRLVRFLLGL